jgi:Heterokaryon incompatibility protein (HET)
VYRPSKFRREEHPSRPDGRIYRKAKSVFIWLGEEDSVSNSAIAFVGQTVTNKFTWHPKWWEAYELTALDRFLGRPWFRRRWILQEAAFSARSVAVCGGEAIPLDYLAYTVDLIRNRLSTPSSTMDTWRRNNPPKDIYRAFYDSPATRLFELIGNVFQRSDAGVIVGRRLHLEALVDLSTFCETSNQRDTIYALLSLAKEQAILSRSQPAYSLVLDYKMELMGVFAGFVLHCCYYSGSLDVICPPWAPGSVSKNLVSHTTPADRDFLSSPPSWISSKDWLPFGNPSLGLTQRLHAKHLVGRQPKALESAGKPGSAKSAQGHHGSKPGALRQNNLHHLTPSHPEQPIKLTEGSATESIMELKEIPSPLNRVYNAYHNTKPDVFLGRDSTTEACNGSLFAKGIIIGCITRRSVRMANAVIPAEGFGVLDLDDSLFDQSDLWRILCADRDDEGNKAPPSFGFAFMEWISRAQVARHAVPPRPSTISVDVEELLQADSLSEHGKRYFTAVRDVVWNRRTFEAKREGIGLPVVGLAPQDAKPGDHVCILYGCSVPVVLIKYSGNDGGDSYGQLVGDAYVHDFMDGEGIQSLSLDVLKAAEVLFEIR